MFSTEYYKHICIIGYILAALGAIVAFLKEFKLMDYNVPKFLYVAYFLGALVTLNCAFRWLLKKEKIYF